jgi:hypothetical protein
MQDHNLSNNPNSKDFYNQSVIRNNLIVEYVNELSANETIDTPVEKV